MAEEIYFENGSISNFQRQVSLNLSLDLAVWHTVVHQSSTSTYRPNFIRIGETFCGSTDGHTYGTYERTPYGRPDIDRDGSTLGQRGTCPRFTCCRQIQTLGDRSDVISLVPKCSKIRIFRDSASDPAEGAYSAPQNT